MADFNGQTITNKGRELLSRAIAGEGIFQFTKAAFGNEQYTGDIAEIEELENHKLDLNVMNVINNEGTTKLTIQVTNIDVEESFFTEEFGVFAKLDIDDDEILYSYTVAIKPDAIPDNSLGTTYESIHDVYMDISSDTETTIKVDESIVYLSLEVANQNYARTGLIARGSLEGQTSLEADKQYQDSSGYWYKNIGGDRTWNGSGEVDEEFVVITWNELLTLLESTNIDINEKLALKENKFDKNSAFNKDHGTTTGTVYDGGLGEANRSAISNLEQIVTSDLVFNSVFNPNEGLPTIDTDLGNQYWISDEEGVLNIPGIGDTVFEPLDRLIYDLDDTLWYYIPSGRDRNVYTKGETYNRVEIDGKVATKEDKFDKNTAHNKDYGTTTGTVYDGGLGEANRVAITEKADQSEITRLEGLINGKLSLAGGILTGALTGTTASFTGDVTGFKGTARAATIESLQIKIAELHIMKDKYIELSYDITNLKTQISEFETELGVLNG